jgi:hypothetical protein
MGINFDKWSPIPNSEIDNLCRNKHVPVKVRVQWAIIRMIVGFAKNRNIMSVDISFSVLAKKTGANLRTIKRIVKQLEDEGAIGINRGHGRGHRNIYSIKFNSLEKWK